MRRRKRRTVIYVVCMSFLFCVGFFGCQKEEIQIENQDIQEEETKGKEKTEQTKKEESPRQEETTTETIWIDVCGAVQSPGVYRLSEGARVFEAIQAAGGFLEGADAQWLNQAAQLSDGQKIQVYTLEETKVMKEEGVTAENAAVDPQSGQEQSVEQGKINLNTADLAQLQEIPGIGEVRAQDILDYREEAGGFKSIEEIQEVPGIKGKTFKKIEAYITVE